MSNSYKEWQEGLKVGDPVYYRTDRYPATTGVVKRVSATMITLDNGLKFRRSTGYKISKDPWHFTVLEQPSEKHIVENRIFELRQEARELLKKVSLPKTEEELVRFIAAVRPFTKEEK